MSSDPREAASNVHTSLKAGRTLSSVSSDTLDRVYDVVVETQTEKVVRCYNGSLRDLAITPFQTVRWIETWYATLGKHVGQPLLLVVKERQSGELAAIFALVRRDRARVRVIEFADDGVSDYNAPLLGPAAPTDLTSAQSLWTAIRCALANGDLLHLKKMPADVQGRPNPLALLPQAFPSAVNGNVVTIEGTWDAYLAGLDRRFRKELGRSWRVFSRQPGTQFRRITNCSEAATILAHMECQQRRRFVQRGEHYELDRPDIALFYRKLVADGTPEGTVLMTALMSKGDVVAALLGLLLGETYVMIRISADREGWSNCSPGRLLIARTMQMLRQQGYSLFDFSIGNAPHKSRFGVIRRPLFDVISALTSRGVPAVTFERLKQLVRPYPVLEQTGRAFLGACRRRAMGAGGAPA
jgi:CelD/BcsL family acetyltransferase involved in cellulose biosynthesis